MDVGVDCCGQGRNQDRGPEVGSLTFMEEQSMCARRERSRPRYPKDTGAGGVRQGSANFL